MPFDIDWQSIDDVLLDMDGTLLDLHYDATFWLKKSAVNCRRYYWGLRNQYTRPVSRGTKKA